MSHFWHDWKELIVGIVVVFTLVFGGAYFAAKAECDRYGIQTQLDTDFYFFGGCFVTLEDGQSVPVDENSIGLILNELRSAK